MKMFKKSLCIFLSAAIIMSIALVAPISASAKKKAKPKLNKKKITLYIGKTKQLKLKKAKSGKVKWKSSKKSVATVSSSGLVTAKYKGKATITAKYKGKKYKCKVTVKPNVRKLGNTFKLYLGDTLHLVIRNSWGLTIKSKNWKSTDNSIAVVNQSGLVTPKKVGRVNVSAEDSSGNIIFGTVDVVSPYAALKSYILKNGSLDTKSNMRYIEYTSGNTVSRIYYAANTKQFIFSHVYNYSDDKAESVDFAIPENGGKNVTVSCNLHSSDLAAELSALLDISKYTRGAALSYTEVSATGEYNVDGAHRDFNSLFSDGVYYWNRMLSDKLEIKIAWVGFTSCK